MRDSERLLTTLRRPALLMRAARLGLQSYQRSRWLRRLAAEEPCHERMLEHLMRSEAAWEETRRRGDAGYSVARHLEVLIALLAETRALRAALPG
ncbi:DUF6477 family protein [Xinfangfangia sp. CPCC 101601]|uniref:DUF6477 family protein n=1 Tax=Pseudogemmobacter lacusdianii TaxID=3069608 RepID=A0ABU0VW86_9RHOB|nr:DUF6477 family protein [Xinfangfangia sp. CPCC 101601]MDQ2065455.1 DUF6477 family protein [Xinfangfangia sp. CPCC 101601]